ncbi:MAG: hypothetical protein DSO07_01530 [Thermoproteota archaeon]|jgi:proteasome assembly chaperone (PAC2) family protein|uniref:Proteasome assembly chaperone family protein n=1 Tax=Candidatus Methanodesulfokora washburnensis TaxID=2478471 RepID=A0A429GQE5_9CREN|nr:PAC2 family protein [Candidatus Methanodesulfokores washburnensis]RSN75961.1 hypothetical protein D6D85_05350 [Candidatus Methanodesulfokores washburnensis]RZN62622.1 MAG: hypothetical protein EF810_02340 [Candidatus Methanodesulfokores washburnensis]TDA42015.1 MAG: hypothetical protein DSO07_01530 [Candidatus Korarchaeota archaeon]
MGWTKLIEYERPKAPVKIAVAGFPGVANVGGQVQAYLVNELKGKLIARIFSEHLLLPGNVAGITIDERGGFNLPSVDFYLASTRPIVLVYSQVQPLPWGQMEVAEEIVRYLKDLGVETVFVITGFVNKDDAGKVIIFGNDSSMIEEFYKHGALQNRQIKTIIGLAGAFLGALKKNDSMKYISITGIAEDISYDPKASRAVLSMMDSVMKLNLNFEHLDKKIAEIEEIRRRLIEELEEQVSEESEEQSPEYVG